MNVFAPIVILVKPQMGENIGAAARAMLNFGLKDLRIVNPRDGWPNEKAIDMAAGAFDQMPAPLVFDRLEEAVADLQVVYATTARRREMVKPVYTPSAAANEICKANLKTGLVFGGERAGLENDDVALCQKIITVPLNADFSSLNLGAAVMLMAYELFQARVEITDVVFDHGKSEPATQEHLEQLLMRLTQELDQGQFFRSEGLRPTMERNIRSMFTRAELSEQEVQTLQGMITALKRS
jgi:tRNA/rRNA methyltransferase